MKANHPGLFDSVRRLPWRESRSTTTSAPAATTARDPASEDRRLRPNLDYPEARQALQVVRWRMDFTTSKLTIERVYLITSLPPGAASNAQLSPGSEHWRSKIFCTTSATELSARTTPRSISAVCPRIMAGLPSPSASTARTATPTSPPPSAATPATSADP